MPVNLRALLEEMIEKDASDLHIVAGERPKLRVDGDIISAASDEQLTPKDTLSLAYSVLTENQKKRFETENELDFSFGIQNLARFRGNVFKQRGCVSVVIRQIPFSVKTFQELGLPQVVAQLADRPRGLVLVTGPTGSVTSTRDRKSTRLNSSHLGISYAVFCLKKKKTQAHTYPLSG